MIKNTTIFNLQDLKVHIIYFVQLKTKTISEKASAGKQPNNGIDTKLPQLTPLNTNTPLPEVDSVSDSPAVLSDMPKSEPHGRETKSAKLEWVEQFEPGVHLTLVVLPNGQKGLKRVNFRYFLSESFHV